MLFLVFQRLPLTASHHGQLLSQSNLSVPRFISLEEENEMFLLDKRFDHHVDMEGTSYGARKGEFFMCSIVIGENSEFIGNWAFGAGLAQGSGGAVFVTYSNLFADKNCTFGSNTGSVGGAVCSLASIVFFQDPNLTENIAFRHGGALYFQGIFTGSLATLSEYHVFYQVGGLYESNTAHTVGGAICFSMGGTSSLQDVEFKSNMAFSNGGAVASFLSGIRFFGCKFCNNKAGISGGLYISNFSTNTRPVFVGRGGGAVYFMSSRNVDSTKIMLYTAQCCFYNNAANNSITFSNRAGNTLFFDGFCSWNSFFDIIAGYSPDNNKTIGFTNSDDQVLNLIGINNVSGCCFGDYSTTYEFSAGSYSNVSPIRTNSAPYTSFIPEPTNYTYQATLVFDFNFDNLSTPSYHTMNQSFFIPIMPTTMLLPSPEPSQSMYSDSSSDFETETSQDFSSETLTTSSSEAASTESDDTEASFSTESINPGSSETELNSESETLESTPSSSFSQESDSSSSQESDSSSSQESDSSSSSQESDSSSSSQESAPSPSSQVSSPSSSPAESQPPTASSSSQSAQSSSPNSEDSSESSQSTDDLHVSETPEEEKDSTMLIVGICLGSLAVVALVSFLVWFFGIRKLDDSSASIVELNEEIVLQVENTMIPDISNDNPLWTTSVMGDTDDPFRNDFEEETVGGYLVRENI